MNIKLFNSDCYDLLSKIPDGSIDLVLIDPPYNISTPNMYVVSAKDKSGKRMANGFGEWDLSPISTSKLIPEIYRVLKPGGTFICFYDQNKMVFLKICAEIYGFGFIRTIYWHKTNPAPHHAKKTYVQGTEQAMVCYKPDEGHHYTFNTGGKMHKDYFFYPIAKSEFHTTPKNVNLLEELITIHTNVGDTVLDCYSGSGSTAVACANTGRNFIGCELDKEYYKNSVKRIKDDTKDIDDVKISKARLRNQNKLRIKKSA